MDEVVYEMWSRDRAGRQSRESLWDTPNKGTCDFNVSAMNKSGFSKDKTYFTMEVRTVRTPLDKSTPNDYADGHTYDRT